MTTVLIVGAGLAGTRAAETLRAAGFTGRVLLVGDEPFPPYERPALSKDFLAGTRTEESLLLRRSSFWADREIELLLDHRIVAVDPLANSARSTRGDELFFDALIIATGARPRRLPFPAPAGVHELRTLENAQALREELSRARLVVVGGGFVGAEVASTALTLGLDVTIVEAAAAPMARVLGTPVGLLLAERWRSQGVDVRVGAGVASLTADAAGRIESIRLTNGTELRADVVVVAVGAEPAGELLPHTEHAHVQGAGDVVGPGHWTAAFADGAAAAQRVLGLPRSADAPHYVWSDQFGWRLQIVGTPSPGDSFEFDGSPDSFSIRYLDSGGGTRAALFVNRPQRAAELRRRLADETVARAA